MYTQTKKYINSFFSSEKFKLYENYEVDRRILEFEHLRY